MEKRRLLIYYPPNKRAIGLNAVIDLLSKLDIEIFVLTQEPYGQLHRDIEKKLLANHCFALGLPNSKGFRFYYNHTKALIRFCKRHKIDIVFSHLQVGNLVSLFSSAVLHSVKFIFFRHHFHYYKKFKTEHLKIGRKELWGEKIINRFAKRIAVPSLSVKENMIQYEGVKPSKIELVPYIYNFSEYPEVNYENVRKIRSEFKANLLLIMCSRFVESKRHRLVVSTITDLIREQKLDIKLVLLDEGSLKEEIQKIVSESGLDHRVFFIGYTNQVMDYMAAADLLVNPSLAEASNSSVKEMGLVGKTVVVCKGIGDFNDYILNNVNGFLIDSIVAEVELKKAIEFAYLHPEELKRMGLALQEQVVKKFSPSTETLKLYQSLIC